MSAATTYAQNSAPLAQAMAGPNGIVLHSNNSFEAHARLDASLDQDAKTCMAGGTSEQQTACLRQKTTACWTQHQALADQQLKSFQAQWQSDYAQSRKAAQEADKTLAPTRYGEAATSVAGRAARRRPRPRHEHPPPPAHRPTESRNAYRLSPRARRLHGTLHRC